MDILIDVLYLEDPILGVEARELLETLSVEPVIYVSHVLIKSDWDERDGEPVSVVLGTKPSGEDNAAIVYTREPFDSAKVLAGLLEIYK